MFWTKPFASDIALIAIDDYDRVLWFMVWCSQYTDQHYRYHYYPITDNWYRSQTGTQGPQIIIMNTMMVKSYNDPSKLHRRSAINTRLIFLPISVGHFYGISLPFCYDNWDYNFSGIGLFMFWMFVCLLIFYKTVLTEIDSVFRIGPKWTIGFIPGHGWGVSGWWRGWRAVMAMIYALP